jgi:hypothetical protein
VCAAFIFRGIGIRIFTVAILLFLVFNALQAGAARWASPDQNAITDANIRQVLSTAQCDDTLIFPGQTLSDMGYYIRHISLPNCIHEETFPLNTATHLGWVDDRGLLSKPDLLIAEATDTSSKLVQNSKGRVFLILTPTNSLDPNGPSADLDVQVETYIKNALDKQFSHADSLHFGDPHFDGVIIYSKQ